MNLEEGLNNLKSALMNAQGTPFSNKKKVDAEMMMEIVDELIMSTPAEIQTAKEIEKDRQSILDDARRQADQIVKDAQARAKELISEEEIVKQAHEYANAEAQRANAEAEKIISNAKAQDMAIRKAMVEKLNISLGEAHNVLSKCVADVTATHEALEKIAGPNSNASVIPAAKGPKITPPIKDDK
jgi:vacuolar-type H+-ATPase subunit H